jgi:hypothetical protein
MKEILDKLMDYHFIRNSFFNSYYEYEYQYNDNKSLKSAIEVAASEYDDEGDPENAVHLEKVFENLVSNNVELLDQITCEVAHHHGGEGEGDQYYTVYEFNLNNESVYIKLNGWYQSYHGPEYTDWCYVKPKEVTVIEYV